MGFLSCFLVVLGVCDTPMVAFVFKGLRVVFISRLDVLLRTLYDGAINFAERLEE